MSTEKIQEFIIDIPKSNGESEFSVCEFREDDKIHRHNCYEFEMLIDGEAILHLNGKHFQMKKGDFWLTLPNNLHQLEENTEETKVICIKFGESFLLEKMYNLLGMYPDGFVGKFSNTELTAFLVMLDDTVKNYNAINSEICKNIFIQNSFMAILATCIDKSAGFSQEITEDMAEHDIFKAVTYVKKHFTDELTAVDMAKRLGYTPNYFSMKFKNLTGKNFIDTVNDERLGLAYYMLSTMDISVNDVSEYVGYSSIAYFSRMFKKKFGKSPREIKKQNKN